MSISEFFSTLGAQLANNRWSWGSVNSAGDVFLRVWQDDGLKYEINGKKGYTVILKRSLKDLKNLGYSEREKHISMIKKGAKCYLIMCLADDEKPTRRAIKTFDSDFLYVGGEIHDDGETVSIRRIDKIRVKDF